MIQATIGRVAAGENLSMPEMTTAVEAIMQGQCSDGEIAMLLTALRAKGETVAEVAGAAAALRKHMTPIRTRRTGLVDTCGTGGTGSKTFNISTTAALVTAAAGVPVAKHGNRGITSRSGSADVLRELGVNIEADVACVSRCLDEQGICFCFAPLLHPSMKRVAHVRKEIGGRTIFNLLGPLSNPAGAEYQLLGVGMPELRNTLAEALGMLGTKRAIVVSGDDGLGEVTIGGITRVTEAAGGQLREFVWTPDDFGVPQAGREELVVEGPAQSAAVVRGILDGKPGPARDIVIANSAAALWTAGKADTTLDCARLAAGAIDSGAARKLLDALIAATGSS